ncbi:MAG: major capsid family protein [Cypionkella sp.]|nr:major capsid family protein [Cypionkella sp.]
MTNTTGITTVAAAQTFTTATVDQILTTVNGNMTAIWDASKGIDMPDTILLPIAQWGDLATRRMGSGDGSMTVLDCIKAKNVYTAETGQPVAVQASHYLTNRMVMYANKPEVVKMYMPMPLEFLPPQQRSVYVDVYGDVPLHAINIRRPGSMRYVTGI